MLAARLARSALSGGKAGIDASGLRTWVLLFLAIVAIASRDGDKGDSCPVRLVQVVEEPHEVLQGYIWQGILDPLCHFMGYTACRIKAGFPRFLYLQSKCKIVDVAVVSEPRAARAQRNNGYTGHSTQYSVLVIFSNRGRQDGHAESSALGRR